MTLLPIAFALIFAGIAGLSAHAAVALSALPLRVYRFSMSMLVALVVFLIMDIAFRLP